MRMTTRFGNPCKNEGKWNTPGGTTSADFVETHGRRPAEVVPPSTTDDETLRSALERRR